MRFVVPSFAAALLFSPACWAAPGLLHPIQYDMRNGQSSHISYHDETYSGAGERDVDGAWLSGGTGQLTDGLFVEPWDGPLGPWVGWDRTDPTITFTFARPVEIDTIHLYMLANRQARNLIWRSVTVSTDTGAPLDFSFTDPDYADHSLHTLTLPVGRRTTTLNLSAISDGWGFLSEVEFLSISPPRVIDVQASGLTWTGSPYSMPRGTADQMLPLPWTRLNQLSLTFDQHVSLDAGEATLTDLAGTNYALFGPFTRPGTEPGTFHATWMTENFLDIGEYTLRLTDGVLDDDGNALDGEWTDGQSVTSGDGLSGGDFAFRFRVLPGDANQDGLVNVFDWIEVRNRRGIPADYSIFHDIDHRGTVDDVDFYAVPLRAYTRLMAIASATATAVPEPSTTLMAIAAIAVIRARQSGRRLRQLLAPIAKILVDNDSLIRHLLARLR